MDFGFLTNNFGAIFQGLQGMSLMSEGGDIAAQGANYGGQLAMLGGNFSANLDRAGAKFASDLAIQGGQIGAQYAILGGQLDATQYHMAGAAAMAEANYNAALTQFNTNRQMDALSRQVTDTFTHNQAIQGSAGVSMGSGSYLAVAHAAMSAFERQTTQIFNNSLIQQAGQMYAGKVQQTEAENEANMALYKGQSTAILDNYKASVDSAVSLYQGEAGAQAAQYNAEVTNQMRQYEGEVSQYQAGVARANAIGGAFSSILSGL